jgi:lactate dehydrogenase-like 2-hydroxyacid dehydrogenase
MQDQAAQTGHKLVDLLKVPPEFTQDIGGSSKRGSRVPIIIIGIVGVTVALLIAALVAILLYRQRHDRHAAARGDQKSSHVRSPLSR